MKMPGGVYCSQECYDKMGAFQQRVEKLSEQPKAGLSFGTLVRWVVIALVVVGILYFVFVKGGVRSVGDLIDFLKGLIP